MKTPKWNKEQFEIVLAQWLDFHGHTIISLHCFQSQHGKLMRKRHHRFIDNLKAEWQA